MVRVKPQPGQRSRVYVWAERLLLLAGVVLLGIYAFARMDGWFFSRSGIQQIDRQRAPGVPPAPPTISRPPIDDGVDFSLWSKQRIEGFTASLKLKQDPALAVLQVSRLRLRVPVFQGVDDLTLNRGAGWISGTARPGDEAGNTAIAAHRDGFFRVLKDVQQGDVVELQMPEKTMVYRVNRTEIIDPGELRVLMPQHDPTLTLVTCYPFYYVGSAPQRFIVQATLQETRPVVTKH